MSTDDNTLILDNINLAYDVAWKYYNKFQHKIPIDELQSICLLGLTKAGKTYNSQLTFTFSTYAYKCMINEILLYYRQNKKYFMDISLYTDVNEDIQIIDMISDDLIIEEEIEQNLNLKKLKEYINCLDNRLQIIMNKKLQGLTMQQIADELSISQPQVSRDYNKAINLLRNKLL